LQDGPTTMLACAAVGAAMLFVRKTLGLRRRLPWLDRLTLALGAAGFALVLLPVIAAKPVHLPVIGSYLCLASVWAVLVAAIAWSRGDVVARWVFAAELPMVLALLASVFRLLGWADLPFVPQYAVVLAPAVEVPLLLVALLIRTRDRHGAEVRAQALSTQDALTGLLAPHLFTDRLRQAVTRFRRDGEAIQESLAAQLARMSPRTRRPIRFIEPEQAASSEPGDSSMFPEADSGNDSRYATVR
jgi:two-component system, sensor histidine kinase LadS